MMLTGDLPYLLSLAMGKTVIWVWRPSLHSPEMEGENSRPTEKQTQQGDFREPVYREHQPGDGVELTWLGRVDSGWKGLDE